MLQQTQLTEMKKNLHEIFGFECQVSLHLQQIAFQFISLCFSCFLFSSFLSKG